MRWTKVLVCVVLSILYATSCQAEEREKRQEKSDVDVPSENEDAVAASTAQPEVTDGQQQQKAAANEVKVSLPVVLPPANRTTQDGTTPVNYDFDKVLKNPCLLYLEGINIFVWKGADTPIFRHAVIGNVGFDSSNMTGSYYYAPEYVNCSMNNETIGESRFVIAIEPVGDIHNAHDEEDAELFSVSLGNNRIELELVFTGDAYHSWSLTSIISRNDIIITPSGNSQIPEKVLEMKGPFTVLIPDPQNSTDLPAIGSWWQYGYACSQTSAIFTPTSVENWFIGFGFVNIQVDLKAYTDSEKKLLMFNRDVSDCVGTFSVGSWMGIFCSLVLASVLMFGYLMLQSVQTMDRFDDPKQKQIVINFKE